MFFSCTFVKSGWIMDASNMKKDVQKAKKDAFILFTGSDWDDVSQKLFKNNGKEKILYNKYGKDFLFYNVDITKNEESTKTKILKYNYLLFSKYKVVELPYIAVRNVEGDVYFSEKVENINNIDSVFKKILEKKSYVENLKHKIKNAIGKEKTIAIDAFFSSIYNAESKAYDYLIEEAIKADPNNESHLVGKFKLIKVALKANSLALQKRYLQAADEYTILLKEKDLTSEERQNAWYQIAYLYAISKKIDNEKILYCLKNAINAFPQSDAVPRLQEIIKTIEKQ